MKESAPPPPPSAALDRFGFLLAVVVLAIIVLALVDTTGSFTRTALANAVSGAALLVAVRTAGVSRGWQRAALALVLLVTVGNSVYLAVGGVGEHEPGVVATLTQTGWVIAALLVPVVVARRLLQHTEVVMATVVGAVAAYLEMAVAFAITLQAMDFVSPEPIFGMPVPSTSYMYVSLVTISTTGFGDLVPTTAPAQLVVASEAVMGQIFLVTFVAIVVGRFVVAARSGRGAPGQ